MNYFSQYDEIEILSDLKQLDSHNIKSYYLLVFYSYRLKNLFFN